MSDQTLTLNSWLVQSERSMHLRCPPALNVTQDEYLQTVRSTAQELELPLQLEVCDVTWVDAKLQQQRIRAKLTTPERFGLLTGLDYVGRVAFVEQKVYLDPPALPTPRQPNYIVGGLIAGGGLLLGLLLMASGGNTTCVGALLAVAGLVIGLKLIQDESKKPQKELNAAIEKWVNEVIDLARRAEVSNELNRMGQALDEAVKLAVDKLFRQRGAEMEADEKRRRTAGEIQQELERRKQEGFK
jgi:hypothetical protein